MLLGCEAMMSNVDATAAWISFDAARYATFATKPAGLNRPLPTRTTTIKADEIISPELYIRFAIQYAMVLMDV